MGKSAAAVSIPGAEPVNQPENPETPIDPRDTEIARLKAQLAAAMGTPTEQLVMEGTGPNIRKAMAESKHIHLTSAQLHAQVMAGEVKLTDHHVLCKDGWYVNPEADKRGREG